MLEVHMPQGLEVRVLSWAQTKPTKHGAEGAVFCWLFEPVSNQQFAILSSYATRPRGSIALRV